MKKLWYKFQLWRISAKYCQLDMDMQCSNMTYAQYLEETELLEYNRTLIQSKLNDNK